MNTDRTKQLSNESPSNEKEGVVKYQSHWENIDSITPEDIAELDFYRHKIWQTGGIGVTNNVGYGNISVRCADNPAHFIISGSQTGQHERLANTQYSKVIYWKIKNNILFCQGGAQASSEALTHAALYEICSDIQTVIHIHNANFWQANLDVLPTSDKKSAYGTPEITQSVRFLFTTILLQNTNKKTPILPNIIIMGGHEDGILVFGRTLAETTTFWLNCLAQHHLKI
jgi:L-ribulose-5-phosphate 4-epimerase